MANFADLQGFRSSSFPLLDAEYSLIDPLSQFAEPQYPVAGGLCNAPDFTMINNYQNVAPFSSVDVLPVNQTPQFPSNLPESYPGVSLRSEINQGSDQQPCITASHDECFNENKRRKAAVFSEHSSGISSSTPNISASDNGIKKHEKTISGRGKRGKRNGKEEEKPREVVHVRARRGQATDSHSLAERVRREKINERLRCLQDIVPGCYKAMGMATMLDEIINYVQSLQNQVEFLSMKLTAASTFYDFNSETDELDTMQRAKAREVGEVGRQMKQGLAGFHTTWPL